jgi:exonuclease SbcD
MLRFLHVADPHLDSPLEGLASREDAPTDLIRSATRRAFENMVQLAIAERVNFIVIAGDLYDGDWRDYSTGLFFKAQMLQLQRHAIPVYLISGNHDAASVITRRLSLPENVHSFSTRTAETKEVPGTPVVIHGRGFPDRAVTENLAREYPHALPGRFNIGLLHTSLTGSPEHDSYAPCSVADLASRGYDYWALGHIHQPTVISDNPWIVFAGNCQGRHARECGPRGCRLVSVSAQLTVQAVDWHDLDVMRWEQITINVSGLTTGAQVEQALASALRTAVHAAGGRLLAARLIFTGATSLHNDFHRHPEKWSATAMSTALEFGSDAVWLEKVIFRTSPVIDPATLAQRDALTARLLADLATAAAQPLSLPADCTDMLQLLPGDLRHDLLRETAPENSAALMAEVQAIILASLATKGADA